MVQLALHDNILVSIINQNYFQLPRPGWPEWRIFPGIPETVPAPDCPGTVEILSGNQGCPSTAW